MTLPYLEAYRNVPAHLRQHERFGKGQQRKWDVGNQDRPVGTRHCGGAWGDALGARGLADAPTALIRHVLRDALEQQHAVDQAHQALIDAQANEQAMAEKQGQAETSDPVAIQRAAEGVHQAQATLQDALDAQDRMRTEQGLERRQHEAEVQQAQEDLDALPTQHAAALARLDAEHAAALVREQGRLSAAQVGAAADAQRDAEQRRVTLATAAAKRGELIATANAQAQAWQAQMTATAETHRAAALATAQAQPTAQPSEVISRASGRVIAIRAEEREGELVVTLEVAP